MYKQLDIPAEVVVHAINNMIENGSLTSPRGIPTYEINNVTYVINKPWNIPFDVEGRELRPFIGAIEALQLVGQTIAPELLVNGSKVFERFSNGGIFHGAYGQRMYGRLHPLVQLLKKDPETRQAVLTIYNSATDLNVNVNDVPCTLSIQFFIRENKLCARTSMRSNDVWLGLPYDLIQFIALQGAVAKALGVPMGWYSHSVGSMHLYKQDVDLASDVKLLDDYAADYQPLWSGSDIANISTTARAILNHQHRLLKYGELTLFELWLLQSVLNEQSRIR